MHCDPSTRVDRHAGKAVSPAHPILLEKRLDPIAHHARQWHHLLGCNESHPTNVCIVFLTPRLSSSSSPSSSLNGRFVFEIKGKVAVQEEATKTLATALQDANTKLVELQAKHAKALEDKEAEISKTQAIVKSKADELEAIGGDLAVIVESAKKTKEKLARTQSELETTRGKLDLKNQQLADVGKTADSRQGDLDAVGQDLADLARKLSASESQVAALKVELETRGDK